MHVLNVKRIQGVGILGRHKHAFFWHGRTNMFASAAVPFRKISHVGNATGFAQRGVEKCVYVYVYIPAAKVYGQILTAVKNASRVKATSACCSVPHTT